MISFFDFCRSFPLNHNTYLERVRVRSGLGLTERKGGTLLFESMGEFDEFDEFDDFQFDDAAIEQAICTAKVAPTPPKSQPLRPSPGKRSK